MPMTERTKAMLIKGGLFLAAGFAVYEVGRGIVPGLQSFGDNVGQRLQNAGLPQSGNTTGAISGATATGTDQQVNTLPSPPAAQADCYMLFEHPGVTYTLADMQTIIANSGRQAEVTAGRSLPQAFAYLTGGTIRTCSGAQVA